MILIKTYINFVDWYYWTWTLVDHRVDGWFLMSSIKPLLFFLVLYFTVIKYGPKWMMNRPPFKLRFVLLIYNFMVAIINLYILLEVFILSYRHQYNWICEPVRKRSDPETLRIVDALHLYLVSKLIEFLDTFFMIIRKKNEQLTFLHVYHHSTMFFFSWIGVRWVPGGCAVVGAIINSFVHVFMYTYYALSVFGPSVAKYLWWKRYITILQLVQFVIGLVVGVGALMITCPFPRWMHWTNLFYMLSYLFLFGKFYCSAYIHEKAKKENKNL